MNAIDRHGVGGNIPEFDPKTVVDLKILADQLRAANAHLCTERDGYLVALATWLAAHPTIQTDEEQKEATDILAQHRTFIAAVGPVHEAAKEPFLSGGRIVDATLNHD